MTRRVKSRMTTVLGVVAAVAGLSVAATPPAFAQRTSLGIPKTVDGHRTNVGLLVLGHSTSEVGDYPSKLAQALNARPAAIDGRNYVVFRVVQGGDGGFLWNQAMYAPTDPLYNRILASNPLQYCTDTAGNRWSVRRVKLARSLLGTDPSARRLPELERAVAGDLHVVRRRGGAHVHRVHHLLAADGREAGAHPGHHEPQLAGRRLERRRHDGHR